MASLQLKSGRERPLERRHPWVFSGAIERVDGDPGLGETIDILAGDDRWLARGAYSPHSQIRARVWTWSQADQVDQAFLAGRLERALAARSGLATGAQSAYRQVHAESDGLPGLIVDRYPGWRVVQILSAGVERFRQELMSLLAEDGSQLYERSDSEVRQLEGLEPRSGPVVESDRPPAVEIEENGLRFMVDIAGGQKTGFYLDQRRNRRRVRDYAPGVEALDAFAYTGGFAANLLAGGAQHVTLLEASADSLAGADRNLKLNTFKPELYEQVAGDAFTELRRFRDQGRQFDLIVLDPPKFAPTRAQAQAGARGYKDINLLAFKLLRAGGVLFTFSCSGGIEPELFQKIVAGAALDAGVEAVILERLSQSSDHPVALNFPEGAYLKGLVCRVG